MPDGLAAKTKADKGKAVAKTDSVWTRISRFFRDSYVEVIKKTIWPTKDEVWKFTLIVIFTLLIVGFWVAGIDYSLTLLTKKLFNR